MAALQTKHICVASAHPSGHTDPNVLGNHRDELHPKSKKGHDWFGLGLTLVDALDTLYIMQVTGG